MTISRRVFLKGALTLTAVAAAGLPALAAVPTIYGDGVHDDTDGFNAMLAGEPFRLEGDIHVAMAGNVVTMGEGTFVFSAPIVFPIVGAGVGKTTIRNEVLLGTANLPDENTK